ncbi:hypothetical protein CFP65_4502 [Kitasatospora sp. MMS16-BH015]|uniref:LolA family protein n=1 Tax=Kitasatospora sp. MMS16-BH015 TaxID=2018025 RepID=UPI000CA3C5C9|nr:DUF2092 domain-containing protein [Kitasatospora sp. MMS16-BH015]AUG79249.1 hypothetical protein CFP65_4502 [Kitasatospora sp. MMS16-BH015]
MEQKDVSYRPGRRRAVRVLVPVAVVAAIGAGVGLVPALASDSAPSLPTLTAEQLVAKVASADVQSMSGTVKLSVDLGLPTELMGAAGGMLGRGGSGHGGSDEASKADPKGQAMALLGGDHTIQVAVDGPDRQRIGLVDKLSGYELVHNGSEVWAWDSRSNEAVHLTAPQGAGGAADKHVLPKRGLADAPVTPQEAAKQLLAHTGDTTSVTVDGTATVAGQKAYLLSVKPKQSGSTIGQIRIAVDADNGVPLSVIVKSDAGATVLDTHFSQVSFAKPDAKTFEFTAPKGAKVTEQKAGQGAPKPGAVKPEDDPWTFLGKAEGAKPQGAKPEAGKPAGAKSGVTGTDWLTVVSGSLPTGAASAGAAGQHGLPAGAAGLFKSLGKPVDGGHLISTKLVNVLITDDGRYFAGAVTLPVLQNAAGVK